MKLYGRDLSPFTRRVAIWCALQGRAVERHQLMVTGDDLEVLKTVSPLWRVPALVLDDGTTLIETTAIVDWLEETAEPGRRLIPETGLARRTCLQQIAVSNSTAEKSVALVYDKNRRPEEYHYPDWIARLEAQISAGLQAMSSITPDGFFGGDTPNGADLSQVCTIDFLQATNSYLVEPFDDLRDFAERMNAIPSVGETRPAV